MPSTAPGRAEIGFGFFPSDVSSTLELAARADEVGAGTVWFVMPAESYDTPTLAAAALARTERVRVGTSIVPAFTRHPLTLATQAIALAELAPGRFRLGIGTGNLATMANVFGTPIPKPASQLREYATIVRQALTTGGATFHGDFYDVDVKLPVAAPVPVVVAGLSPRMFAIAGEVSDGAMSWMCPVNYLHEVATPAVAKAAAAAGRDAPPIVAHVPVIAVGDGSAARAVARQVAAQFGANAQYAAMFAASGFPLADDGTPSDELLDALYVIGDETALTDRLGALAESGFELLVSCDTVDDRRAEHDIVLRAIGNVARSR